MSSKTLIESYATGGRIYGRVSDPEDFMLSQDFAHAHVEAVVRALLTKNSPQPVVEGFARTLTTGLSVSVAAGQVITAEGQSHDTFPDGVATVVTMPAAHVSLPRVDLVYARIESVDTELAYRPHVELVEFGGPEPDPTSFNVPTQRQHRATVLVKQGTAAASPSALAAGPNEVPLYNVAVAAGATSLVSGNVTDVRNTVRSLYDALVLIDALNANPIIADFAEAVRDALQNFFPDSGPYDWAVSDPGNIVSLDIAVATGLLKGLMSAADKGKLDGVAAGAQVNVLESVSGAAPISAAAVAGKNQIISIAAATASVPGSMSAGDKAKLDAATAGATANAIAQRDANGDVSARDYKPTRRVLMPDGSQISQAEFNERQIAIFDLETAIASTSSGPYPSGMVTLTRGGIPFYVNVKAEDFSGITLCLEVIAEHYAGTNTAYFQLWNVTDNVEAAVCNVLNSTGVVQTRSAGFTLTGTGRKRLQMRIGMEVNNGVNSARIYAARIIVYPQYASCGGNGQSACPV
jgi:hypothetical protein